ncbi:apolipoprotein N-acyltransferase [Roseospira visakhapatnamensis]|uniref:Apolipoprotein N-acyltransferase n=1 Tax=Roseospira visakhapatnamensis TaxID=390880 RepID=A0A7W6REW6_9PROT|nr:apolipoprotein N-acyltransferase [Roseospira visakhapatnamensis]MBB4267281.1 apolipoprotein N-acyltransferase [Roseospira visakhapatnamensis]
MMARVAAAVRDLRGWRRHGTATALGAAAALALPPFHVVPALLVGLTGLVWLLDGAPRRRGAFAAGWWFGLGWFAVGLHWIAHALLVDAARFGWLIPLAIGGLAAVLALFTGLGTLLAGLWWRPGRPSRVLVLAGAWTLAEALRGWAFTGFPWNQPATVWMPWPAALQTAALIGALGLSALTVLALAAPAVLADAGAARWRRGGVLALAGAALLAPTLWGQVRLTRPPPADVAGVRLRLVQPNYTQAEKWDPARRDLNLLDQVEMSRAPGFEAVTHVIWSETASVFPLATDTERRRLVAAAAPPGGLLLTGAPRVSPPGTTPFQVWNSLLAVTPAATIAGAYDKHHLVPFGEYVPFRDILPLEKITPGALDFTPGPGPTTLDLPGTPPVSPLICYEVIFPGQVVDAAARPTWMVNVTNDGWYGTSPGPYQHLATARLRAVEEGVPLVRVANTGISAVVDAMGRVTGRLDLGTRGVLDAALPGAMPPTPFARLGMPVPLALALALLMAGAVGGWGWRQGGRARRAPESAQRKNTA